FSLLPFPRPPISPLFPYTTLFRSSVRVVWKTVAAGLVVRAGSFHCGVVLRHVKIDRPRTQGLRHGGDRGIERPRVRPVKALRQEDRKSTRLNSSHSQISYAVFCLK